MPVSLNEIKSPAENISGTHTQESSEGLKKLLSYEIGGNRLSDSFREAFYSELALLLEAGMNIKSALDLMAAQQKKEKHRKMVQDVVDQLVMGGRFSEVLQAQGKKFSAYEYFSVKIGEESGNLVEVLKRLASFYEQKIQQRRTLTGALTYPGIILLTAAGAVTFMLSYMVPLFRDIFGRMGGELPWLTQMIIRLSEGFGNLLSMAIILFGIAAALHIFNKSNPKYLKIRSAILLRIPVVGQLILKTYTLRFVQSMSLLVNSKVPLTEALELSQRMVKFYPIKNSLSQVRMKILQGMSLNEGLAEHRIYNSRFVALIKVGEESNQLSLIFQKLSSQMESELQHKAKMLGNTLEPLIIIFLGALVAVILVAMYLPMFQISTSIGV